MVAEMETGTELTTAEAAALAGVSDRTIRNWIKGGHLKATKNEEGRRIHKDDLLSYLRGRAQSVAGVLGQEALAERPAEAITETVARMNIGAETTPVSHQNGHGQAIADIQQVAIPDEPITQETPASQFLAPEMINLVLQPLREELEAERKEKRRLHDENVELAGRVGYYQAKVQEYESRILLLEAPKEMPQVGHVGSAEAPEARKPWYKRLFAQE